MRALGVATPIVACTANALGEERDRCTEAGMNDYLAKPFRCEDLEEILLRWVATPGGSTAELRAMVEGFERTDGTVLK